MVSWPESADIWWRRSTGRCSVSIVRWTPPGWSTKKSAVIEQCGRGHWNELFLPNGRRPQTVGEQLAVAEAHAPMSKTDRRSLRVEPRYRNGMATMEVDHYVNDRLVDTRTLTGARRRRKGR